MTKSDPLPYLPTMFATCMLFQVIYVLCVALWVFFPELKGHALLADIFPQFKLLDIPSFVYGRSPVQCTAGSSRQCRVLFQSMAHRRRRHLGQDSGVMNPEVRAQKALR